MSRVRIASSVMTQSIEERASTLYTMRNDDATARDVVIEHPGTYRLDADGRRTKPAESSATGASLPRRGGAEVDGDADRRREMQPIDSRDGRLEHLATTRSR